MRPARWNVECHDEHLQHVSAKCIRGSIYARDLGPDFRNLFVLLYSADYCGRRVGCFSFVSDDDFKKVRKYAHCT